MAGLSCDSAGIRTQDHYIKSVMLYQLSYGIFPNNFGSGFDAVSVIAGAKVGKPTVPASPMPKIIRILCFFFILALAAPVAQAKGPEMKKADSLFVNQRFTEARELYTQAFLGQKKTSKANLLKLAFLEEGRDNALAAIYYLHQFYLLQPEAEVKHKIEDLATQQKLQGYSIDEADYGYFLYRTYVPLIENALLVMAAIVFIWLLVRKFRGVSLGYSPVFTLLFLAAAAYFNNFSLPYKRAILNGEKTLLMSAPSSGAKVEAVLDRGHRIEWISEKDVWLEIKWNEKKGWVKKSTLLFFL